MKKQLQNYDPLGIKLLTRLRLGFSHHSEHKFRQLCWLTESVYFVLCLIVSLQNMIIIIMEKKIENWYYNMKFMTKCFSITKCDRILLLSASGITKCDRMLLQSET